MSKNQPGLAPKGGAGGLSLLPGVWSFRSISKRSLFASFVPPLHSPSRPFGLPSLRLPFLPPSSIPPMVGVAGFEPATLRLSSACSNQLSYTPSWVIYDLRFMIYDLRRRVARHKS